MPLGTVSHARIVLKQAPLKQKAFVQQSSMVDEPLRLWGMGIRTLKVRIVAAFAGVDLKVVPDFTFGVTNRTPHFLERVNSAGKVGQFQIIKAASLVMLLCPACSLCSQVADPLLSLLWFC